MAKDVPAFRSIGLGLVLLAPHFLMGQTRPETKTQVPAGSSIPRDAQALSTDSEFVKITIRTSRQEVTLERSFGIYADFRNEAKVPIAFRAHDTRLAVQPEVISNGSCVYSLDGFFPTEPAADAKNPDSSTIILQPGESYSVFWEIGKGTGSGDCPDDRTRLDKWLNYSFIPGNYVFTVVGKVYFRAPEKESGYHTFTESAPLHVAIAQTDAIKAAVLGGILGYLVVFFRPGGGSERLRRASGSVATLLSLGSVLGGVVSAVLVSATVTILLSRVSQTSFPIKVSVDDFWGSLTIGFVAYFVGNRIIDGLANWTGAGRGKTKTHPDAV